MKLLVATGNRHKLEEIAEILRRPAAAANPSNGGSVPESPPEFELLSLADFPGIPPVVEDGRTLLENAVKKAMLPALASGLWTVADDTGLEVPALGGAPGVYSARYAGPDCDFAANCRKLLDEMKAVPTAERSAVFRCVIALSSPGGQVQVAEGRLEGRITGAPAGSGGFGYDPVFFVPARGKTLAEMSAAEKNSISHRFLALDKLRSLLADSLK